jgi:hypothetical protein
MTMRVTMRNPRRSEDGLSMLLAGTIYTVSDAYGKELVQGQHAVDTDNAIATEAAANRDQLLAEEARTTRGVVSGDGIIPHPRYWFHGSAVRQAADDGVFRDMVAGNHGVFGANLSRANAWTNRGSGYVSTVDPTGGSTDSVIRIPGPNFDYAGGESLFIMWAGQVTPEGSDMSLMGTSASTSANGVRIRANSTGRLSFVLYDTTPTSAFSTTSTDNALGKPFVSGERHSFAIFIDGRNRLQYMWIDGLINVNALTLSSGTSVNTLSSGTWNIGAASQSPGGTEGIASKTLAFAGFKFLATDDLPAIADLTAVAQAFDNDPSALVAQGAM